MNAESSIALLGGSLPLVLGGMAFASNWMLPANAALVPPGLVGGVGRVGPVPVFFVVPEPPPPPPPPDPEPGNGEGGEPGEGEGGET